MGNNFCNDLGPIISLLITLVTLLQWLIPIGLIIYGMLDLGKAVISSKEDEMKKATSTLVKRVIYAIAVFFVVTIVSFAMGLVGSDDWKNCWNNTGGASNSNSIEE